MQYKIPGKISIEDVQFDSLKLRWADAHNIDQNDAYVLEKQVVRERVWKVIDRLNCSENGYKVEKLHPMTEYLFRLKVTNGQEDGPYMTLDNPIKTLEVRILLYY